jgi:DNA-binding winged helix-turn-helix (wHTH) protein/Tfp pilus assembly protein PilF
LKSGSIPSEFPLNSHTSKAPAMVYRFEEYELDCAQWQLTWRDENIPIQRKSFDLLLYLLKERPRVVGKEEILEELWPNQYVDENNLARQVSLLRKALSKHELERKVIETVPGRGYKFIAEVQEIAGPGTSVLPDVVLSAEESITRITLEEEVESDEMAGHTTLTLPAPAAPWKHTLYKVGAIAAGILLVSIGGWLGWRWWQNRIGGPPVEAVLMPLDGSTGDATLDHVLDDTVRADLSQSPFLTVATRTQFDNTLKQMQRKPGDPVTEAVAREVCERINNQAIVHTAIARDGQRFLLTGEAVSCVNGAVLASTTEEANRVEDLRLAVNRLTGRIRGKLGESRSSVERFNTPLPALETASLDALKAASTAGKLANEDKGAEAIAMEKQAIAYDPNFTAAYYGLSSMYINVGDMKNARAAIQKAFDLRSSSSPLLQFTIASRYEQLVTRDLYSAEKSDVGWTELYPRQYQAWNALDMVREGLGEWPQAAEAGKKTIQLRSDIVLYYGNLMQDQLFSSDLQGSRATCDRALALSPDYEPAHLNLARIAYIKQDAGLYQQQIDWLENHPKNPLMLSGMAELAIAQGRFAQAKNWIEQAAEIYRQQGDPSSAAAMEKVIALELLGAGDSNDGLALYHREPVDPEESQQLLAEVFAGDGANAESLLKAGLSMHPNDTRLLYWYAPLVRGWNALKTGHPGQALELLNQPGTLSRYADIDFARGEAYLAAKQPQAAEAQFRRIVDHPYRDQSYISSVAWVELARALSAEGNRSAAKDAYRHFLELWQSADANAALLLAARREAAALN